jgi:hypothetical protein
MHRKPREACGWNASDRSPPYGSWSRLRHRDFAMTDEIVRVPLGLAVRLHVDAVQYSSWQF